MYAKNAWKKYSGEKLDALMKFNEEYKHFITVGKTERACVNEAIKLASDKGFKELKDSIVARDTQIDSLVNAFKEMLAEKINEKYKYYISIKGIPEDEYEEFVSLHDAYNEVGGNHHGDAKFQYCMEHLPVIPVKTKLVYKE